MLCTPFPSDVRGPDPGSTAWYDLWREACRIAAVELGGIVRGWQVGNEMNSWFFRMPLRSIEEAAEFVAAGADGICSEDPTALVGTNAFGLDADVEHLYRLLHGPDFRPVLGYVGVDLYSGAWHPGGPDEWRGALDRVATLAPGVPIIAQEFGLPSRGRMFAEGEVEEWLASNGYRRAADVVQDPAALLRAASPTLRDYIRTVPPDLLEEDLPEILTHVLNARRYGWGGPVSTPETQAAYLERLYGILLTDRRVAGTFVFSWHDFDVCYRCGSRMCDQEPPWGLTDVNEDPKPAWWTVKQALSLAKRGDGRVAEPRS
jgi:hypothetical protein